jgi:hypothetical protein
VGILIVALIIGVLVAGGPPAVDMGLALGSATVERARAIDNNRQRKHERRKAWGDFFRKAWEDRRQRRHDRDVGDGRPYKPGVTNYVKELYGAFWWRKIRDLRQRHGIDPPPPYQPPSAPPEPPAGPAGQPQAEDGRADPPPATRPPAEVAPPVPDQRRWFERLRRGGPCWVCGHHTTDRETNAHILFGTDRAYRWRHSTCKPNGECHYCGELTDQTDAEGRWECLTHPCRVCREQSARDQFGQWQHDECAFCDGCSGAITRTMPRKNVDHGWGRDVYHIQCAPAEPSKPEPPDQPSAEGGDSKEEPVTAPATTPAATEVQGNEDLRQNLTEIDAAAKQMADALAQVEAALARIKAAGSASADGVDAKKFDPGVTAAVHEINDNVSVATLSTWHELADNAQGAAQAGIQSLEKYRDAEDVVQSNNVDGSTLESAAA